MSQLLPVAPPFLPTMAALVLPVRPVVEWALSAYRRSFSRQLSGCAEDSLHDQARWHMDALLHRLAIVFLLNFLVMAALLGYARFLTDGNGIIGLSGFGALPPTIVTGWLAATAAIGSRVIYRCDP